MIRSLLTHCSKIADKRVPPRLDGLRMVDAESDTFLWLVENITAKFKIQLTVDSEDEDDGMTVEADEGPANRLSAIPWGTITDSPAAVEEFDDSPAESASQETQGLSKEIEVSAKRKPNHALPQPAKKRAKNGVAFSQRKPRNAVAVRLKVHILSQYWKLNVPAVVTRGRGEILLRMPNDKSGTC